MAPFDIATRAQAITLKVLGVPNDQIERQTGIKPRSVNDIFDRAISRGFDPNAEFPIIRDIHVEDAPRSGRPTVQTDEKQEEILKKVRRDRYGREKICAYIVTEVGGVSAMIVWRILRKAGLKKTKPTRKPGLTNKMKKDRLEFCRRHEY